MTIDDMRSDDWPAVARIYQDGLELGTFEERMPSWDEWDASHLAAPRLVARDGEDVLGWAALAPVSRRACYRGVAENSVYVGLDARGRGVGRALLDELCRRADGAASGRSRRGSSPATRRRSRSTSAAASGWSACASALRRSEASGATSS